MQGFRSFDDFYPFYLGEHSDPRCRALHYAGSIAVLAGLGTALALGRPLLLGLLPILGYGPAWLGHFAFEKNRPATFRHPVWSLMGDYVMLAQAVTGRLDRRHFKQPRAVAP